jgi:hypothetical protein
MIAYTNISARYWRFPACQAHQRIPTRWIAFCGLPSRPAKLPDCTFLVLKQLSKPTDTIFFNCIFYQTLRFQRKSLEPQKDRGGIDEGSIDGVDKTIDNKVNVASVHTGGWCTYRKIAEEHSIINQRSMYLQIRAGEAPECEPVPLHRASRHVGRDVTSDD